MALAEAARFAIPIVATRAGAATEAIPPDGALWSAPGDVDGLSNNLRRMIADPRLRMRMHGSLLGTRDQVPSWDGAVAAFAAVLERVHE
jgi:glycosyltransferase involved in cell wall biosynthesis